MKRQFNLLKRRKKNDFKGHFLSIFLLAMVAMFLLAEISVFVVYNVLHIEDSDAYTVVLFVVPGCAVLLTGALIWLNYRTYERADKIIDGLNQVADGNFSHRIVYDKKDVFEKVYSNFNKMASELSTINTLRENFVHDFSHEFKTPIACINGFANLLLEGNLSEEEQKQYLKIIADESQRLSRLSQSTLLLSRLDNSNFVGEKTEYRLDEQLKDCIILLENSWAKKNITLNTDLEEVIFFGNAELMQQVWLNLLYNAIKFSHPNGEINVSLKVCEEGIRVEVADNGVGIDKKAQSRIFEKYYKADKSRSTEGNGLGLAIVKRVCNLHGGDVLVNSELGKGSTFIVTLPL